MIQSESFHSHTRIHACTHTRIHACTFTRHTDARTYSPTHTHARTHARSQVLFARTYSPMHTRTHAVKFYSYAPTHPRTHARTQSSFINFLFDTQTSPRCCISWWCSCRRNTPIWQTGLLSFLLCRSQARCVCCMRACAFVF